MKAVILAGGKGTRLAPYTTVLPKPLLPVGGVPILETVLRQLKYHGCTEVVLAVGYLAPLIRAYFDENPLSKELDIRYYQESEPLGTAGALPLIEGLDEPFLAMNGDILTTLNYSKLLQFHKDEDAALTVAVTQKQIQIELGVLDINDNGHIVGYDEKPVKLYPASMGIYIYSPKVLELMEKDVYLDIPSLVLKLIEMGERVSAYKSDSFWLDMGNRDDYERASAEFEQNRVAFLPDL